MAIGKMQADSPSRQQCEQHNELLIKPTEESTSEPTATLNERIQELAQRSQELQERNDELEEEKHELEKEKNRFAKKAWNLEISLRNKRERLWGEMSGLQDALQAKKEEPQEALDSRADHRQAETVLREEFGSLRRRFREQDASLSQATTESNEKVREASEREGLLKETVKQLEKRLQDQNKLIRDQQASFSNVTAQSNERARDANVKQALLKENVEQLEQRLINQRRAFEEERAQWQQSAHTGQTEAQTELTSSLERAMPELRSLLSAYDRVHVNEKCLPLSAGKGQLNTTLKVIGKSHSDLTQRLKEQQRAFDQERAQVLEQASDAAETQRDITRRNLLEREKVLICPITLELFDFPVVTGCCGKTLSSEGLRQAIKQNPLCPFCRGKLSSTHPNRDVAKLVELHRRERFVLGIVDPETPTSSAPASQTNEHSTPSTAPTGRAHSSRRNTGSTRHPRHREHRSDRVQARSQVPHRPSTTVRTAQVNAAPDATSIAATTSSSQPQERSITPGRVYISTLCSDAPATRVPPHMVRSVLASLRFPSARPQSTATGRRLRARPIDRAASTASLTTASASRRRTASATSRAASRAVPSATATAVSSAQPNSTPAFASQSKRRVRNSTTAACNTPVAGVPTRAASSGATSDEVKFTPPIEVASAPPSATATSRNRQRSRSSGSSSVYLKAWLHAPPAATSSAASRSAQATVSSIAITATSTATTSAPRRPIRISASQDDSALGRERHDSPRLTASQPAPRQPFAESCTQHDFVERPPGFRL